MVFSFPHLISGDTYLAGLETTIIKKAEELLLEKILTKQRQLHHLDMARVVSGLRLLVQIWLKKEYSIETCSLTKPSWLSSTIFYHGTD